MTVILPPKLFTFNDSRLTDRWTAFLNILLTYRRPGEETFVP